MLAASSWLVDERELRLLGVEQESLADNAIELESAVIEKPTPVFFISACFIARN
jgi:hypothetical protein